MALKITDACINCGACAMECPNTAIYEGGVEWQLAQGTTIQTENLPEGIDVMALHKAPRDDIFYIVKEKCTECVGFTQTPQCAAVCPVECCVPDLEHTETQEALLKKKQFLHGT